ncbi:MAG: hypothetical protein HY716_12620 [Planctomycetes bacterium]|nr:hypothetical protein [Planctomycetota bacterium]
MARRTAGLGFSIGAIAAVVVVMVLVLRKGPVAALVVVAAAAVLIGVLGVLTVLFGGKKKNG